MSFEQQFDIVTFLRESTNQEIEKEAAYFRTSPNIIFLPWGLQFVRHVGGYFTMGAVVLAWACNSFILSKLVLFPLWYEGVFSWIPVSVFCSLSFITGLLLFRCVTSDPGRIPFDIHPTSAEKLIWTHCQRCLIQRPLKSHHCSKCQRCTRKMDIHCPCVNNCIGEDNQWLFLLLVFYGLLHSLFSLTLDIIYFNDFPKCLSCPRESFLFQNQQFLMYGVFVSSVGLLFIWSTMMLGQVRNIILGRTTVEGVISLRKVQREWPRDDGPIYEKFRIVCGPGSVWKWFNPFRQKRWKLNFYQQYQEV